jgi:glucosyl-3-phosphoglycerate synthase
MPCDVVPLPRPDRSSVLADWPVDAVTAALRQRGLQVAVVIPARDEAATIGAIVAGLRSLPADLVGEIVVVDSCSADRTAAVAAEAGARVLRLTDVHPHLPARPGKGEAMWRGLAATTAPIVVFVDGDLIGFDPRIVAALAGPLLDPQIRLVKAAYDRPGSDPDRPHAGGGRVTELMARPLIGAFWPELAGIRQPLAGEYAARRDLLEALPFRCGYGVELGLLVDTASLAGPGAITQVDLGSRRHRNADLGALGRMAAEVLHTALDRLEAQGRLDAAQRSALIGRPGPGDVAGLTAVDTAERPPLARFDPAQDDQIAT